MRYVMGYVCGVESRDDNNDATCQQVRLSRVCLPYYRGGRKKHLALGAEAGGTG